MTTFLDTTLEELIENFEFLGDWEERFAYLIELGKKLPPLDETEMTDELPQEVKESILSRIPQSRMGRPEEVADVVAFLATRGHYVNGSVLHVNGGMYGG